MAKTYLLLDFNNLLMRVRYGTKAPDIEQLSAIALHIALSSIKSVWTKFVTDGDGHVVIALEGKSWRKDIYAPYKANRKVVALNRSPEEVEDDKVFFDTMNDFVKFLKTKTNASVLQHVNAEADDKIARWIALHPEDQHVLISTDSDFQQLLAPNVKIYNGIAGLLYTINGIFDVNGNRATDKKGIELPIPNPGKILFDKCLRGDSSDNIFSAYPGVRKTKIQAAWDDRDNKGFAWNNLMLSKWTDENNVEHIVRDDYNRNRLLVDLTQIPPDLCDKFDAAILETISEPPKQIVGVEFMKFCNRHGLVKLEKQANDFSKLLSAKYTGHLLSLAEEGIIDNG
jgi:hypothetical protein